ncbi:hypothetical protein FKM82_007271 [Ascaphus truei]
MFTTRQKFCILGTLFSTSRTRLHMCIAGLSALEAMLGPIPIHCMNDEDRNILFTVFLHTEAMYLCRERCDIHTMVSVLQSHAKDIMASTIFFKINPLRA